MKFEFKTSQPFVIQRGFCGIEIFDSEENHVATVFGHNYENVIPKASLFAAAPLMLVWLQSLRKNYNIDEGDCIELDKLIGKFNV